MTMLGFEPQSARTNPFSQHGHFTTPGFEGPSVRSGHIYRSSSNTPSGFVLSGSTRLFGGASADLAMGISGGLLPFNPSLGGSLSGPVCPIGTVCCEYDPESRKCIGGCCSTATACCPDGKPGSGDQCKNLAADSANCGKCGHACSAGQMCCGGQCCTPSNCCNNQCVDTSSNPQHCGTCANSCGGGVCAGGKCVGCPTGLSNCSNTCVNLQTDTRNCGNCGHVCTGGWTCQQGTCSCSQGQTVFNGCCITNAGNLSLSSNSNYLFSNSCNPILGLTVSLQVTQDLNAAQGFSFQLNAYNPAGPSTSWMQYVIMMNGTGFAARIEYWDGQCSLANPGSINCITFPPNTCIGPVCWTSNPASIPGINVSQANIVPAGYTLQIQLSIPGGDASVVGAQFTIFDNMGNSYPLFLPVDPNFFFPIVAFQADLVGYDNGNPTTFQSGAGNIIYETPNQLCVEGGLPEMCAHSSGVGFTTAETSNITYGAMGSAGCCGSRIDQSFKFT
jgi:hypothetical protein